MADEPDDPLAALSLATIERPSSRGSADTATRPNLFGLTAADAELFDEHAAFKRGAARTAAIPSSAPNSRPKPPASRHWPPGCAIRPLMACPRCDKARVARRRRPTTRTCGGDTATWRKP